MDFRNMNVGIKNIELCCFVGKGQGETVHTNRKSYGLAYHVVGEISYRFKNAQSFSLKEHSVIFLPKNSNYYVSNPLSGECYAINFELTENTTLPPFTLSVKNYAEIEACFRKALYHWQHKKAGYEMKCRSLLYNIIYIIQSEYHREYQSSEKLKTILPAMDYISQNYVSSDLRIGDLSNMCGICETYFRKIFFDFYGTTPVKYIQSLRLERAAELLKSGYYSVYDVMVMSGFEDPAYFSRSFKKHCGVSPNKYKFDEF